MKQENNTMTLKPYPQYKDSCVQWLGQVPKHWEVRRLRFIASITTGNKDTVDNVKDGFYPFFVRSQTVERINTYSYDGEAVLTAGDGVGVAKVFHYINGKFDYHQRTYKFSDFKNVSGKYFYYYMKSNLHKEVLMLSAKSTVDSLRLPMLKNFMFLIPVDQEQTQIARFLDYKTSLIARFIRAKRRLIELLKEQKQVIINDAVTGKIDVTTGKPYPKYKDSGVQWLGQVPEGWEVRRLKTIADVKSSGVDKKTDNKELSVQLCNYIDVYKNKGINSKLKFMKATATQEEIDNFTLRFGDIVITKDSETWKDIAVPSIVTENINVVCGYHLSIIRISSNEIINTYLYHCISSEAVAYHFRTSANGVTRFGLSQLAIKNALIPIPPLALQSQIVAYIETKTSVIDNAISRFEREIALIEEYRTRLISDVVTGKVDVRDIEVPDTKGYDVIMDDSTDEPDSEDELPTEEGKDENKIFY